MRVAIFYIGLLGLVVLSACSSSRPKAPRVLMGQHAADTARHDTLDTIDQTAVDTLAIVYEKVEIDSTLQLADERFLTPEEKIARQKMTGVYRDADWASAIHYDLRKPNFVILHHTSQNSVAQTVRTFQLEHTKVSAHYVIGRDGQTIQMLNDYERAWHAGRSKWGTITDINSASIGIELDNNGREPYPEPQVQSLLRLLDTLKTKYQIPQVNFLAHGDVAPGRKNDPNSFFPWKRLAQHGFGIWYNEDFLLEAPATFNPVDALKIMGYDMTNPEAAIRAFKRRFIGSDSEPVLTDYDKAVLFDLYRKYY